MFKHGNDLFKEVQCPGTKDNGKCSVINCIFKHYDLKRKHCGEDSNELKRVDIEVPKKDISILIPIPVDKEYVERSERSQTIRKILGKFKEEESQSKTPNRDALKLEEKFLRESNDREVYLTKLESFLNSVQNVQQKDARFILPKDIVGTSPATMIDRKKYIQQIVSVYRKYKPDLKTPILKATEDEMNIASSSTQYTYANQIKRFIFELQKNKGELLKKSLEISLTNEELLQRLDNVVLSKETLQKYGYIMEIPDAIPNVEQKRTCHRCGKPFTLQEQMKDTKCYYHSGRNRKSNSRERKWDCCGGIVGDADPCSSLNHHVFYWSSAEEMHTAIPYINTDTFPDNINAFKALGIDCEMGFTTKGFELLRTTAIDFITGEEVLDILVRPKGEIIDLNTKWSGVAEIKDLAVLFENHLTLLQEVMDKNTILIGHGLENDMNAMRLVHHRIVDTSILYPKHKTAPMMKYSLKYLCFTYLGRTIQTGEHDSGEDSLGAIDVVKYFLKKENDDLSVKKP